MVGGNDGLHSEATLGIDNIRKNAEEAIRIFRKLKAEGEAAAAGKSGTGLDTKALTEYQKQQLIIKQGMLDLAKAKQDQASAEKSASIAYQETLRNERIAREAITTTITRNKLEQQQANIAAREQAAIQKQLNVDANKKKPTQISNTQAEIDAYKRSTQGSILYTSTINAETVARARLNAMAAATAVANGTLNAGISQNIAAIQQQTTATGQNVLSKRQLAQMLAEEKYRQQQSTAELKNNAREMLNAKGSLEQRRAALIRLTIAYDQLSAAERNTAAGSRLASVVKGITEQVKELESATGRGGKNINQYAGAFTQLKDQLLSAAAGMIAAKLSLDGLKEIAGHNAEISDSFTDVQRTAKLSGEEVDDLIKKLKGIDTRTNLEGLLDIGFIGGRLGVAKEDMIGFITTVDQLSVVLKKEFPGGAEAVATALGKIISVYKITQKEGITLEQALKNTGSSFLELAHNGQVTVQYLQDFALRTAGVAQIAKISLPTMLAYGAVLSQAGITAQVAGSSVTRLISSLATKRDKFFAIAQLSDSTLTIEKFTNLINTDTKAALELFFKGLKAGNPTQTEFGDRLKTLALTTGAAKNAVIALAENQDLLFEKTKLVNKANEDGASVTHNFELANNSLGAAFDKLSNKIANAFTSSSGARALAELLNGIMSTQTETEKLSHEYENNKHRLDELDKSTKPLLDKYDLLKGKSKLTKDEQEQLRDVTAKIGALLPGVTTKFDEYGNSLDINRTKITDLSKAQREYLELQNRSAIQAAKTQFALSQSYIAGAQKDAADPNKTSSTYNKIYDFLYGGDRKTDADVAAKDRITRLSASSYEAAKAVRDLGGVLTAAEKKVIDYYEALDAKNKPSKTEATILQPEGTEGDTPTGRTIDAIKADIKRVTELKKPLDVASKQYKIYIEQLKGFKKELKEANGLPDTEGKASERVADSIIKSRNTLQKEIDKMIAGSNRKQMTADDAEVSSISEKYDTLREKAKEYYDELNKKIPKNKQVGFGLTLSGINTAEINEKQATINKGINERFKAQLEEQTKNFEAVEDYRQKYGADKAQERYTKEFNISVDTYQKQFSSAEAYAQKLEDVQTAILNKYGDPTAYTDAQKQELAIATENIVSFSDKRKGINDAEYAAAYASAETLANKMTALDIEYANKKKAIFDKEAENGPAQSLAMYQLLDEAYKADADSLIDAENAKSKVFKRLAEETLVLTRSQITEQISGLENAMKDITIPQDLKDKVQAAIGDLKIRLNIGVDQVNLDTLRARRVDVLTAIDMESKKATPSVTGLKDELEKLNNEINGLDPKGTGKAGGLKTFLNSLKDNKALLGAATGLNLASDAAMTLSEGLGGVDTEAGYTLDTIGKLAGAAGDLAGSIASGDPAKIIGSAIKAVGTLFAIGKKVKEMNAAARKEVADYYTNAIAGEREYQDLLKDRQIEMVRANKAALQGIRDEISLRSEQTAAYKKEADEIMAQLSGQSYVSSESYTHGTWFRKAKVNKTYESLQGMGFSQLSSLLSQGKLEGDAKALVERLKELEQKGYDAEKAIAELAQQTSELFTGTTSDNLTNALAEMFASGKTSAQDLADFFKQSMDDAALSIFKNKVLAEKMESFYAEFDKAAQSGDELTSDEIARLNGLFTSLTGDALKKFEEFQKITGSDLKGPAGTTSGTSSLTASLGDQVTEQTASNLLQFKKL